MATEIRRTLPGVAYHSEETYAVDTERVFYRNWVYVGRAERVAKPGAWLRVEIAGESILVVRGKDEQIRAFYNVCRHRGSRICDDEQGEVRTHLRCPYHAWGYALDGTLVTTPMIEKDEIDRPSTSLWPVHVDVWEGFVFVNLSREEPRPLLEHLADQQDEPLSAGAVRPGRPAHRPHHHQRGAGQLEDRHRELQRVPALPDDPPRAGGRRAGVQEGRHLRERPRGRRRLAGRRAYGDRRRPAAAAAAAAGVPRPDGATRSPTTARWSTPRCSSTSTGPAAWPPQCSRPARRAAGW